MPANQYSKSCNKSEEASNSFIVLHSNLENTCTLKSTRFPWANQSPHGGKCKNSSEKKKTEEFQFSTIDQPGWTRILSLKKYRNSCTQFQGFPIHKRSDRESQDFSRRSTTEFDPEILIKLMIVYSTTRDIFHVDE